MNEISNLLEIDKQPSNKLKISKTGKILVGLTGGLALGLTVLCAPFVSPALRKFCLPYVPATNQQILNVLEALKNRGGSLIDLGSGDGRIVIEMARNRFTKVDGVELNPWLVLYSKIDSFRKGLSSKTDFMCRDLWKFNLGTYNNVVIFGVEQMMTDLEKKLELECCENCHIVACRFPLPNKKPLKTIGQGVDTVWLYKIS